MPRNYLTLLLLFGAHIIFGQDRDCDCIAELNNVSALIKNAKSYRYEIKKKDRITAFNKWQDEIEQEIEADSLSRYFCVGYLQKYISFIDDRHNQIYFVPDTVSIHTPTYSKAIDTTNIKGAISGIYHAGNDMVLVKKENDSTWLGITLKSGSDVWSRGKIRLRINKTPNGNLELFEYYKNGLLFYQKNIEISGGRIHSTFWNKENAYFFNKNHKDNFNYTSINPSFDYMGIKTLSRTSTLIKEAETFYGQILPKLTKKNIIIDLRNNGGGAINQARALLKSLKRNQAIQHIYVLINFKTASSAELLALKLKEDKRTIIAGENSRGMLTYGYGNHSFSTQTNCYRFQVTLSTKHENKEFSSYESVGIPPDLKLDNKSDWIDQIVTLEAGETHN